MILCSIDFLEPARVGHFASLRLKTEVVLSQPARDTSGWAVAENGVPPPGVLAGMLRCNHSQPDMC